MNNEKLNKNYITISKICNKYNFSIKKFILFLENENLLLKTSEYNEKTAQFKFIFNQSMNKYNYYCLTDNSQLYLHEKNIMKLIYHKKSFNNILFSEEESYINQVNDIQIKQDKIKEIKQKMLLFIDFEFQGNYYTEVSLKLVHNNHVLQDYYLFKKESLVKKKIQEKHLHCLENNIKVNVLSEKHINKLIKNLISKSDYIISHNSSSEKKIIDFYDLNENNIEHLCTERLTKGYINFIKDGKGKNGPTLNELAEFFNMKVKRENLHYAFYDNLLCYYVYHKLFSLITKNDISIFPLNCNIKK